mgnify:CR=1 FL=1
MRIQNARLFQVSAVLLSPKGGEMKLVVDSRATAHEVQRLQGCLRAARLHPPVEGARLPLRLEVVPAK